MLTEIIGIWKFDPNDIKSIEMFGNVTIEFKNTGDLIYTSIFKNKIQKIFMTYQVKGNKIVTDQATTQKKEETEFRFLPDGKLELSFDGVKSKYLKEI